MAGERCLESDFRGLPVPDFSDHYDIRVLTQDRPQGIGKGDLHCLVHLNLGDPVNLIFYRVFNRGDIYDLGVEGAENDIKGR